MRQAICFLYGAGEYDIMPILPREDDYVIAVDGGFDYLLQANISPDLIIGDFDSVSSCHISKTELIPDCETLSFPPEKDYTDMHLGVKEGIIRGFDTFVIYGGLGGRIDHSLANIQLLAWLSGQGMSGYLIGSGQVITSITNTSFSAGNKNIQDNIINALFSPVSGRYISIISHSDISEGVTIKGLRYETDKTTLTNTFALGTSNNYTGSDYIISVKNGTLIIVSELV